MKGYLLGLVFFGRDAFCRGLVCLNSPRSFSMTVCPFNVSTDISPGSLVPILPDKMWPSIGNHNITHQLLTTRPLAIRDRGLEDPPARQVYQRLYHR